MTTNITHSTINQSILYGTIQSQTPLNDTFLTLGDSFDQPFPFPPTMRLSSADRMLVDLPLFAKIDFMNKVLDFIKSFFSTEAKPTELFVVKGEKEEKREPLILKDLLKFNESSIPVSTVYVYGAGLSKVNQHLNHPMPPYVDELTKVAQNGSVEDFFKILEKNKINSLTEAHDVVSLGILPLATTRIRPLDIAVKFNRVDILEKMKEQGVDFNANVKLLNWNAFHLMAFWTNFRGKTECPEAVKFLLDNGCNPDHVDTANRTYNFFDKDQKIAEAVKKYRQEKK